MIDTNRRMAIFVDVQNLYYAAKIAHNTKVSYDDLLKAIAEKNTLIRAIAYAVSKDGENSKFLRYLNEVGFDVRDKQLVEHEDGTKKGNWDVEITADILRIAPKVDTIVLVSGDGDFTYLVDILKADGLRVEVWAFKESTAKSLYKACDSFYDIAEEELIMPESEAWNIKLSDS